MKLQNAPINERQIVYFIDDKEVENLPHYDEGKKLLLSKEIQIIPLSETEEFLSQYDIIDGKYPTNQTILVLSPTNPTKYAEVEESTSQFALHKLNLIIRLCQYLGAKKVTIEDIYTENEETELKTKTEAEYTVTSGNVETSNQKQNELKKYIGYTSTFQGAESNYELAKTFLKKNHLSGDAFLSNLVEMFDPLFSANPLNIIRQEIKLTSVSSNTFNLLANLKVPVGGGQFTLNKKNVSKKDYFLTINIEL